MTAMKTAIIGVDKLFIQFILLTKLKYIYFKNIFWS